jgi:hypothetical protein
MGKEIDEAIADALAVEEVEKAQLEEMLKKGIEEADEKAREDFKDILREHLNSHMPGVKVEVDLDEYVALKQKETDLDRILTPIMKHLKLSYGGDYLIIDSDSIEIARTIKALYPNEYDNIYKSLLKDEEAEG